MPDTPKPLSDEDRAWLYRLLRKERDEARAAAKQLRLTPSGRLSRRALDTLAHAHEEAAGSYDRAIDFHCADLARAELLRRIE
jgi:hypothetical protein